MEDDYYEENDYNYEFEENNQQEKKLIQNEIIFLDESEINKERNKIIDEAKEYLFLNDDEAKLAMIYYNWNIDKLENWFQNVDENRIKAGIDICKESDTELKKKGIISNSEYCLICYEEKNENFFSLKCGHQFCADCWTEYLQEKIKSPLSALYATCPQNGCNLIVFERIFKKYLKNKKSLDKLDKSIFGNFINRNGDIKQCPNEYCHLYAKSSNHGNIEVNCPCKTFYCFSCGKEGHRPCSCEIYNKFISIKRETSQEEDDQRWIEANTKECPHCHQKIQKSQGCNYMFCDPKAGGCGNAFCYVCENDWSKHNDHFKCNRYTEKVKEKERKAKEIQKELEKDLKKYERYDFYYSRYKNLENSVTICQTTFEKYLNEKINLIYAMQHCGIGDFILNILHTIINAKRTLKNTYIFGYYMKETKNKELFEYSQGILEFTTESLHKLLIDENLNMLIEAEKDDFILSFQKYKEKVEQKISVIEKYKINLINEIENKFIGDLDNKLIDLKL